MISQGCAGPRRAALSWHFEEARLTDVEAEIAGRLEHGDLDSAATVALRAYGKELLGFLASVVGNESDAREVFSQLAEDLWRALPAFRRECSFRTFAYRLAWHGALRYERDGFRRRVRRLMTEEYSRLEAEVRSTTHPERARQVDRIREALDPDERALLVLRVDRALPWEDAAAALSTEGKRVSAAALRKRFERLAAKIARLAAAERLLSPKGGRGGADRS